MVGFKDRVVALLDSVSTFELINLLVFGVWALVWIVFYDGLRVCAVTFDYCVWVCPVKSVYVWQEFLFFVGFVFAIVNIVFRIVSFKKWGG